jgi:hypothetical protein
MNDADPNVPDFLAPDNETRDQAVDRALRREQLPSYSDATRYLCVGAERDESFAHHVLTELFDRPSRAIAPSYGIDVGPIVKHCVKGQRRRLARDLTLCLVILLELMLFPVPSVLTAAGAALLGRVLRRFRRRDREAVVAKMGPESDREDVEAAVAMEEGRFRRRQRSAAALLPFWAIGLLVWMALGEPGGLSGAGAALVRWIGAEPFVAFLASVGVVFMLAWLILCGEWLWTWRVIGTQLREATFEPEAVRVRLPRLIRRRLRALRQEQYGNVTVYGAETDKRLPFVGAGTVGRWWSFSINLQKRADDGVSGSRELMPFTPVDLHRHVEARLKELRREHHTGALPGLETSDHIFLSWFHRPMGEPTRLPFPDAHIDQWRMDEVVNGPAGPLRHFKCIRIEWQGREQISTVFLHLATEGRTLYMEFTPCLMSPIPTPYKAVDMWTFPPLTEVADGTIWRLPIVVSAILQTPRRLLASHLHPHLRREWGSLAEAIAVSRKHVIDYGARRGVRELGSIGEHKKVLQLVQPERYALGPRRYLQLLDAEKYTKAIEIQTLDAILDFLDDHGVDTSEFRTRQAMILNEGVFVGSIEADVVTVGQNPRVHVDKS